MNRSVCIAAAGVALADGASLNESLLSIVGSGPADVSPRLFAQLKQALCYTPNQFEPNSAEVQLSVTQEEAVVLDSFLRRFSTTGTLKIEHPAEQISLWNLECLLERDRSRPDWPSLDDARNELLPSP